MSAFMDNLVSTIIEKIEKDKKGVNVENILKYAEDAPGLEKYRRMPGFFEKLKEVAKETIEFREEVKKFSKGS